MRRFWLLIKITVLLINKIHYRNTGEIYSNTVCVNIWSDNRLPTEIPPPSGLYVLLMFLLNGDSANWLFECQSG